MTKNINTYGWIFFTMLLVGSFVLATIPKGELLLLINKNHRPFLDLLFKYSTFLGDGIMFGVLALVFVFKKRALIIDVALTGLLQLSLVALLKHVIFDGMPRPKNFFNDVPNLHFVEGVKVHMWNSFPSGHTTTAFGVATLLAFTIFKKNPFMQVFVFCMAFLAGYSRVYLLQHFFVDVYAGAILGFLTVFAAFGLKSLGLKFFSKS